jgi:hypothetical protein
VNKFCINSFRNHNAAKQESCSLIMQSVARRREVFLLSTALSDMAYTGSPDSPSGVIGVYLATM